MDASASPSREHAPGTPGWPHGLVTTTFDREVHFLSVSNPENGFERLKVHLPEVKGNFWSRRSFSADWTRVVWTTGKGPVVLHLAELRGKTYTEIAKWELPGSKQADVSRMGAVFIGDTSRVWTGWLKGDYKAHLFSVDAKNPAEPLRKEKGDTLRFDSRGRVPVDKTVSVTGRPSWGGFVERTDTEAVYAVVQSEYTCDVPVTPLVLACWGRGPGAFGVIATLTAEGKGGRVTMRQVAPKSIGNANYAMPSPDSRNLIFKVPKKGWYLAPVDGSAPPKLQFDRLFVDPVIPIDWI